MADKSDDTDEDEDEESGGGKKKIIMAVGGLAALGAVYQFVLKSPPPPEDEAMMAEETPVTVPPIEGEILELDEMILNIGGEETGYLRIGLAIILQEGELAAEFETEAAIAKDIAVQYLSARTADELRSTDGRQTAKEELSQLLREAYGEDRVVRVLFTALVMQ